MNTSLTQKPQNTFDSHTLRVLEYEKVIGMLAERCASALGVERARELLPSSVHAFIRERQQETGEARLVTTQHGAMPLGGIHDVRPSLVRAEVGQSLTPHDLLDLSSTLISASRVKGYFLRHAEKAPLLADRARAIEEFPQLVGDIELSIGRSGDVLDSASPGLAAVRSHLRQAAGRITDRLNQILNSATFRPMIQDPVIVLRDDRRCIPVRAEYRREFKGIVHDQSSSGATLFMEPMTVVELNNELRQLEVKERQEVERVLAKLTAGVARQGTKIHGTVEVLAGMDLASAKAKLADDMQASEPVLNRRGLIRLRDARHPLLDPETVVPLNLHLGDKFKVLLITGPNTGGKTVGLKTVGLLTLMAQAGLQIPAAPGSELAHFDQVYADIGDEQSIAQSLSTFSAHITNIVRILKTVGRHALVLMDEIGAGTDPAEGAALAKAILNYLYNNNARVIATTHYGELKEYAYSREGIENAAVEFNPETLRPTYRLLQGVPGSSNAFHIARRLGMPHAVVDEARDSIGQAGIESGEVMRRLEKAKRVADEERRRAERLSRDLEEMKAKYEARLNDLETLRREAKQRAAAEAQQLVRRYQDKTENIIGELRRLGKEGRKTNTARKKVKEASEDLIGGIGYENEPMPIEEADVPAFLKKGDRVRVLSLGGATGEVLANSADGEATVQVGMMRVIVPLSNLRVGRNGAGSAAEIVPLTIAGGRGSNGAGDGSTATLAFTKAQNITSEITLIGMRVDAALPRLDKYLDDAFAAGLESIRIVHGKGTGQLRRAIWEYLKDDSRVGEVTQAHPDEGGAGATIIRLRQ
jgi:DNA mismatch repair protein MutS2